MSQQEDSSRKKRIRHAIELPYDLERKLSEMAEESDESHTELIRQAVRHFLRCRDYRKQGYETGAWKEIEGKPLKLVIIL